MSDNERYERLRLREAELVRQLKELQRRYMEEAMPIGEELTRLREHRDPLIVELPNGMKYQYNGPRPDYKLPEEQQQRPGQPIDQPDCICGERHE